MADDVPRYVGTHGMRPLADNMVSQVLWLYDFPTWLNIMSPAFTGHSVGIGNNENISFMEDRPLKIIM